MKILISIALAVASSCSGNDPESCTVVCETDAECLGGQTCGDLGRCTSGELCAEGTCEPGAFLGCPDEAEPRVCNEDGNGVVAIPCGGFGCSATADRCNECAVDQIACAGDELTTCTTDGLIASADACTLGCANASEERPAHCETIVPVWIPEACNAAASEAELVFSGATLDTSLDAICNGGVITQQDAPDICVVRARHIALGASVSVIGRRAIAFVADQALDVTGLLDVSARGPERGPGGIGAAFQVGGASATGGGGGAGSKQSGGHGGSFGAGGGVGGGIFDPLMSPVLRGGPSAVNNVVGIPNIGDYVPLGGGGGGAALLISCSGSVTVTGTIEAGGGGGRGGRMQANVQGSPFQGGAGGGAGGYVVMQGADVVVTGKLFANGGGGGGGTSIGIGEAGQDGAVNGSGGLGGQGTGNGTAGGTGGVGATNPGTATNSAASGQAGGGGGSVGRFQVYTPTGITPTLTPVTIQPAFEPNLTVPTR